MSSCSAYLFGDDPVAASQSASNGALRAIYLRGSPFHHPDLLAEADASQAKFDAHIAQRQQSCQINSQRMDASGRFVGCPDVQQDLTNVPMLSHGGELRRVRVVAFPPFVAPVRPQRGFFDQTANSTSSYSSY